MSRKLPTLKASENPLVVAEKLLRQVLPADMYAELAATGKCSCVINGHEYTFSRTSKTLLKRDDRTFSCCIEHADKEICKTDQIVSEYLLALNDEDAYLKTANLTEIGGIPAMRTAAAMRDMLDAQVYAMQNVTRPLWIGEYPDRIGDTIQVRLPRAYGQVTPQMLLFSFLLQLTRQEAMQGLRWPVFRDGEIEPYSAPQMFRIELGVGMNQLSEMNQAGVDAYVGRAAFEMALAIRPCLPRLLAFGRLLVDGSIIAAEAQDPETGIAAAYTEELDIHGLIAMSRFSCLLYLRP